MSDVATLCEHCGYFHPEMHVRGIHGPFCPYQTAPIQSPASGTENNAGRKEYDAASGGTYPMRAASGTEMPEYVREQLAISRMHASNNIIGTKCDNAMVWLDNALARANRGWVEASAALADYTMVREMLAEAQRDVAMYKAAMATLDELYAKIGNELSTLQEAAGRQQARIDHLRAAGNQLANCAYNLVQLHSVKMDERERTILKRCQEDWDRATSPLGASA